jgi:hypothetical protein
MGGLRKACGFVSARRGILGPEALYELVSRFPRPQFLAYAAYPQDRVVRFAGASGVSLFLNLHIDSSDTELSSENQNTERDHQSACDPVLQSDPP